MGAGDEVVPRTDGRNLTWDGISMSSLRDVPTMTRVRSRLLDVRLLQEEIGRLVATLVESGSLTVRHGDELLVSIDLSLNIIDESVEVINAAEERLPKIARREESDRVG